ncbi:ADP-ribosylglycohydrolase family protein [Clostridium psychrophilum]|uniref:ADP-ribosylglycohydrolase family protein n=1 Tax=Clostridium psychrophilum TaxID=132926 RepID=UPI001C0D7F72|nr:ADP-ribosylglycohydrolase family protein [Clostridium psychrophilum]MBU3182996.1 ADP-ribosylglycohydrolase family protein [Clostridium psychrophilum]
MPYVDISKFENIKALSDSICEYSRLKCEYGSEDLSEIVSEVEETLKTALSRVKEAAIDKELAIKEPNDLEKIHRLRAEGPRKLWDSFDKDTYREKLEGAFLSRIAGCTLGAPVEFWTVESMENWAEYIGDAFPPIDYWSDIKNPSDLRYEKSKCYDYTRKGLNGVPVDDDIVYTLLGLLIAEDSGVNFTTEDVGKSWIKYLPYACTAEDIALKNLKKGIPALEAADVDNPYCQWIGADIRSDTWAYMAPAYPEKAAEMAYKDAYLSHRRNGIYGEMFFSATQSAAFVVDNAVDALKIGLTEIPQQCALYKDIEWALNVGTDIKNYKEARLAVEKHFIGMSGVHTNNNACLTVFGLMIGGNDVTKVLSEIVAMGMDNDCTAATAGSIVGAIVGIKGVPEHWYKNFNNTVLSYLIGKDEFKIDDLINRFMKQAVEVFKL